MPLLRKRTGTDPVLDALDLVPQLEGKCHALTTQLRAAQQQVLELNAECGALTAQLKGDIPAATAWLMTKVWRQRLALDRLNRTVTSQRFVLRTLEGLGRSLTAAEYRAAREADRQRDRIDELK